MKPYYQDEAVTIYHGDALDVLPRLPAESIDLVIADPPYGMALSPHGRRKQPLPMDMITNDHEGFDPFDHLTLALKALRNNRHFYVFGPFDVKRLHQCGPSCELIWDKGMMSGGNTALPWGPAHERITFGTRCRSKVNIAEGYGKGAVRMRRASVLRFDRPNAARPRNHLAEKPVALLRELI